MFERIRKTVAVLTHNDYGIKDFKAPIRNTLEYRCCALDCDSVIVKVEEVPPGFEIYRARVPEGWHELWGGIYCPKHKLHIRLDDGKEWDV